MENCQIAEVMCLNDKKRKSRLFRADIDSFTEF